MANKENLPPRKGPSLPRGGDTPPGNPSATLGIRHWQHAASSAPPPFGLLAPGNQPSLARQRDHSACRSAGSPLHVRKTREALRQAGVGGHVPPPCVHAAAPRAARDDGAPPALSFTSATTLNSSVGRLVGFAEQNDLTGTTLVSAASSLREADAAAPAPASPPLPVPGKMARHKSVSRRMLSRVKEGIAHRSRSSHSGRPADDQAPVRRRSGRRKHSGAEEQSRSRSFEVSRESIESQEDVHRRRANHRSFTDSSISTHELVAAPANLTPPPSAGLGSRRPSSALLPPSPTPEPRSPVGEPTPRALARGSPLTAKPTLGSLPVAVPYIDLRVGADRRSVDVNFSRDVWVAVEATVRTKLVGAGSASPSEPAHVREQPIDAVVVLSQDAVETCADLSQQCFIELCARLSVRDDRLAVLVAKPVRRDATAIGCECAELHSLQPPRTAAVLDKLGFTPTSARDSVLDSLHPWQPLRVALGNTLEQGTRHGTTHVFVLSPDPVHLVQAIASATGWPTHAVKVGQAAVHQRTAVPRSKHCWSLEIRGEDDDSALGVLDNVFRDIRHDCHSGVIPSLRLCYKPMNDTRITEVVGEMAMKDLGPGKRCSLFIKVRIPSMDTDQAPDETDQDSLFAELKSIVGTLESNFLHVEARYRHSSLPSDHVATVRQICSIKRPRMESRWSLSATSADKSALEDVHVKLARFLASHYPSAKALKLIDHWNLANTKRVLQVRRHLELLAPRPNGTDARTNARTDARTDASPTVIVTDADTHHTSPSSHHSPTAAPRAASAYGLPIARPCSKLQHSSTTNTIVPVRTTSSPQITTATAAGLSAGPAPEPDARGTPRCRKATPAEAGADTARQIWHHIRRNSSSATQMLEASPHRLQQLEAADPVLKELRGQALANKRSVGAETLKAWKWDGRMSTAAEAGEAPWL